mgnify:CR=1 FL=1
MVCRMDLWTVQASPRQRMLDGYCRLGETLGAPGVTERAAQAILDQVNPCSD